MLVYITVFGSFKRGEEGMKGLRVSRGNKELLGLKGQKKYAIQATVRTLTILNPGEKNSSSVDREVLTLHREFFSEKTPQDIAMSEVRAFLEGFETASVKVNMKERLSRKVRVLSSHRIERVELFVYTPNGDGWYFQGQLDVSYKSLFPTFCKLAEKAPNRLPNWGNYLSQ